MKQASATTSDIVQDAAVAFAKLFTATNRATGQKETVEMRGHESFVIPSVQMNARVMNGHPPPSIASFMRPVQLRF